MSKAPSRQVYGRPTEVLRRRLDRAYCEAESGDPLRALNVLQDLRAALYVVDAACGWVDDELSGDPERAAQGDVWLLSAVKRFREEQARRHR